MAELIKFLRIARISAAEARSILWLNERLPRID